MLEIDSVHVTPESGVFRVPRHLLEKDSARYMPACKRRLHVFPVWPDPLCFPSCNCLYYSASYLLLSVFSAQSFCSAMSYSPVLTLPHVSLCRMASINNTKRWYNDDLQKSDMTNNNIIIIIIIIIAGESTLHSL